MTKQGQAAQDLDGLTRAAARAARGELPPVHLWNPPFCGDLDMRIAADGTWFYLGTPIGRPALARLFSTVLKREGEQYFLVTPVEKIGIRVDDVPFLAVEMTVEGGGDGGDAVLRFRTNVGDEVRCDAGHGLQFERRDDGGLVPYLHVRAGLWARVTRALYYDLVDRGQQRMVDGRMMFGVASGPAFFAMAAADETGAAP